MIRGRENGIKRAYANLHFFVLASYRTYIYSGWIVRKIALRYNFIVSNVGACYPFTEKLLAKSLRISNTVNRVFVFTTPL